MVISFLVALWTKWLLMLIYASIAMSDTVIDQHLLQQGIIILAVLNSKSLAKFR